MKYEILCNLFARETTYTEIYKITTINKIRTSNFSLDNNVYNLISEILYRFSLIIEKTRFRQKIDV